MANFNSQEPRIETSLPYLQDTYAPVPEVTRSVNLKVEGEIPVEFRGSYFRNGPNPLTTEFAAHHWFDGDGMIHKIEFRKASCTYFNRYIETKGFAAEQKSNSKLFAGLEELGQMTNRGTAAIAALKNAWSQTSFSPARIGKIFKDTANTDLIIFRGKMIPLWWLSGVPYEVDLQTLETKGVETFGGTYSGDMSAHARVDAKTGELFFLDFGQIRPFVSVNCVGADGKHRWKRVFELPYPRVFHDLLFTENFIVLMDFPMGFLKDANTGTTSLKLDTREETGFSRIVLIDRRDPSKTREFKFHPTFVLHGLNAFETGESVTLQVIEYPRPVVDPDEKSMVVTVGALKVDTQISVWKLDLATGGFSGKIALHDNCEFGRINDEYLGTRSRFCYLPKLKLGQTVRFDSLIKFDFQTGEKREIKLPEGLVFEEPVFVPRIGATSEDDGWLGTIVNSETDGTSEFRIYDAASMEPRAKACVKFPKGLRVPAGFHGKWHPSETQVNQ